MTNQNSPLARWTSKTDAPHGVSSDAESVPEKRKFISPLNLFARRQQPVAPAPEAVPAPALDDIMDDVVEAPVETAVEDDIASFEAALQAELNRETEEAAAAEAETADDNPDALQIVELDDELEESVVETAADIEVEIVDEVQEEVVEELAETAEVAASADETEETVAEAPAVAPVAAEPEIAPVAEPAPVVEPAPRPEPSAEAQAAAAEVAAVAARRGSSRVKTTFLGFERSDGRIEDVFEKARESASSNMVMYPVGWIVIVEGPGRGNSMTLQAGVSQIGRGDDQAIQLDFGDTGISRSNHAAIAYDDEDRKFYLGHGGKSNIVRLNGKPVLSTEELQGGDRIRIGETTMVFVAFCGPEFHWTVNG